MEEREAEKEGRRRSRGRGFHFKQHRLPTVTPLGRAAGSVPSRSGKEEKTQTGSPVLMSLGAKTEHASGTFLCGFQPWNPSRDPQDPSRCPDKAPGRWEGTERLRDRQARPLTFPRIPSPQLVTQTLCAPTAGNEG